MRENCTLRASGEDAAQGGPGGGAGILCPTDSTLVITGPGAVSAVGGNASDGEVCGQAIGGSFVDGGAKALVIPFDPTEPSMFYRIDVGD